MTRDNICEECGAAVESLSHLFWHYKRSKEVWKASDIELETNLVDIHLFLDIVWYAQIVKQMSDQTLAQLVMTA